ncbi:MAG: DUF2007 domain-containing protein [Bacteroidales bacterium]|nr:DUF2007 domain-containing protein [Bacteroidales bacterium]
MKPNSRTLDSNWTKVYTSTQQYKVELIKGLLAENNIESVSVNKQDSAYLFGEIELYVHVEHAFKANQIIKQAEREE